MKQLPLVVASVGIGLGVAITVVLLAAGAFSGSGSAHGSSGADASEEFVAAYRRSLEATYTLEGSFTRTMSDGRVLESGLLVAQRPPDHIRRQFGGVSGALSGRTLVCSTGPDGRFMCGPGSAATPYSEETERHVATMESYFAADSPPLYSVVRNEQGCFELTLLRAAADPSYGSSSTMCFDDESGAMTTFEIHHPGGAVDRIDATSIRPPVESDFDITQDATYNQHTDDLQGADVPTPADTDPGGSTTTTS